MLTKLTVSRRVEYHKRQEMRFKIREHYYMSNYTYVSLTRSTVFTRSPFKIERSEWAVKMTHQNNTIHWKLNSL